MRDDLLEAQSAIDWAVTQIKVLTQRITKWRRCSPYFTVTEPDSDPSKELIKVREREPIPLVINAEAGAIINMIRSSLDILAVALAERNGNVRPKDVYFPVAASALNFIDPIHGAIKKIKRLSDADQRTIKQLKPYDGGDGRLYSLHQLDIMRKHRRLVGVALIPRAISMYRWGAFPPPEPLYTGKLEDGTPLFRVPRGTNAKVDLRLEVTFNETPFANRRPVTLTLTAFAERATEIIKLFDTP